MNNERKLMEILNLTVDFPTEQGIVRAVSGLSLSVKKGEILGLVGESGSGKTMTALSILRLVPQPGHIAGGEIWFENANLLSLNKKEMEEIRGNRIGMVFQEPMTALNPVLRIGDQIGEGLAIHGDLSRGAITERTLELLDKVGFQDGEKRLLQYPHQLSGGQRQRVLIAIAISCNPSLVIADEPTTALDVATESQILELLNGLVSERRASLLLITHNLHVVRRFVDRVGIMYAGRLLELNSTEEFFSEPLHPYGKGLVESILGLLGEGRRLKAIPGSVPRLLDLPSGCTFHPRCPYVMARCHEEEPRLIERGNGKWVRCYLYED
jgi:oligopeptide/dipeptide ABC transporter ATP-binding protein